MDLADNQAFDRHLAQRGWLYDNGGRYREEYWEWYAGPVGGVVLLRQSPDRIALVRFTGLAPHEIWLGHVSSFADVDEVLKLAANS